ncbi:hypothetical protein GQ53DRAFT_808685 [Thozetella sp. PMI_491]|nr:hypothetical protein GQ53DRAFT_808685 [Thozetella sp. PMI_491]
MHCIAPLLVALVAQGALGFTQTQRLDQTWANHQQCVDMTGSPAFLPEVESSLMIKFQGGHGGTVSVVVFELGDEHLGGMRRPGTNEKEVLCTAQNIERGLCATSQLGEFLISEKARRKAGYPFITRAVNLSAPVSIHYPVSSPGYYCVAAILSTGNSFSADMVAIEPGREVPAFKAGVLGSYRYLAPAWMAMALAWEARQLETHQVFQHGILGWLVPLSGVQVGLRWAGLETGGRPASVALTLLWSALETIQDVAIIIQTHRMATVGQSPERGPLFTYCSIIIFLVLQIAASWAAFFADAASRGPSQANVLLGFALVIYIAVCTVRVLRRPMLVGALGVARSNRGRQLFAGALVGISLLFGIIAVANMWVLAKPLKAPEFAQYFWQMRYWLIDTPTEATFLLWLFFLAVFSGRLEQQQGKMTLEEEEETKCLRSSMDASDA